MSFAARVPSESSPFPQAIPWVNNRGEGFRARALKAHLEETFPAILLLVLTFRFFGLAAFVLVLVFIVLLNLRYESAIAHATAGTPRALLIRVRGSVRTFALQDIARIRAAHLSSSDRALYVRPRHGRRGFFYALPRGRVEEIPREVETARRALAEPEAPTGESTTPNP